MSDFGRRRLLVALSRILGMLEEKGLTAQQARVLLVAALKEGSSVSSVVGWCQYMLPSTSASGVSRALRVLSTAGRADSRSGGRGLVTLKRHRGDKRVRIVYLTSKGRRLVQAILDRLQALIQGGA